MQLTALFNGLADALTGPEDIEKAGAKALRRHADAARYAGVSTALPNSVEKILTATEAHPICSLIAQTPLNWAPPETSDNPAYVEVSKPKVHVELIGPEGIVRDDSIRLGLYGMLAGFEYGLRTHPAEETFVMLAGKADWKRGDADYAPLGPGGRSYHPSMLPHANRTTDQPFMSIYIWNGDISTANYVYKGA